MLFSLVPNQPAPGRSRTHIHHFLCLSQQQAPHSAPPRDLVTADTNAGPSCAACSCGSCSGLVRREPLPGPQSRDTLPRAGPGFSGGLHQRGGELACSKLCLGGNPLPLWRCSWPMALPGTTGVQNRALSLSALYKNISRCFLHRIILHFISNPVRQC